MSVVMQRWAALRSVWGCHRSRVPLPGGCWAGGRKAWTPAPVATAEQQHHGGSCKSIVPRAGRETAPSFSGGSLRPDFPTNTSLTFHPRGSPALLVGKSHLCGHRDPGTSQGNSSQILAPNGRTQAGRRAEMGRSHLPASWAAAGTLLALSSMQRKINPTGSCLCAPADAAISPAGSPPHIFPVSPPPSTPPRLCLWKGGRKQSLPSPCPSESPSLFSFWLGCLTKSPEPQQEPISSRNLALGSLGRITPGCRN